MQRTEELMLKYNIKLTIIIELLLTIVVKIHSMEKQTVKGVLYNLRRARESKNY